MTGSPLFMNTTLHPFLNSGDISYYGDLFWSCVGPHHDRASFNLLYLADAYAANHGTGAPYRASSWFGFRGDDRKMEPKDYATMPAAKRAARAWLMKWLSNAGGSVQWEATDTGVHFMASADGLQIGSYYHCPKKKRHWHKGFRAHFGMTFYREHQVTSPDEAKDVIAETWADWLRLAKARFLKVENTEKAD